MRANGLVVAIDGPSGAGKSTAGRALAVQLGYTYIDTGAMYRALALKASRSGVSLDAEEALAALLRASSIQLAEGGRRVLLDGHDVTTEARSRETSRASSLVSVHPGVRVEMVARQREMGKDGGVVLDLSSDAAVETYETWGGYAASKAALDRLALTLGRELSGIRAYAFDPGDMRTAMHQEAFPGEDISDRPLPEEVAVPMILRLLARRPPSGRYRAEDLHSESTSTASGGAA